MASEFPTGRDENVALRPRIGHDMRWSCDKHLEPIKLYCKQDKIPLCHVCATKNHQKPCELEDIEDVIVERKRNLDEKEPEIEEAKKQLETLDSKIKGTAGSSSDHLERVKESVQAIFTDQLKNEKDNELQKIQKINKQADEEIRIINEKREKQIKSCQEESRQRQKTITENQTNLMEQTNVISKAVAKKMEDLSRKKRHAINTMNNIESKMKKIKENDQTLVNEVPQVLASIKETLSLKVHQDVSECLDLIQREIHRVRFVQGTIGGQHYGRIDGYTGKWESVKSIQIPPDIRPSLSLVTVISDDEICMTSGCTINVANISTERIKEVKSGNIYVTSCAPLNNNVTVCGYGTSSKYVGPKGMEKCVRVDGFIILYNRQWEVIGKINIANNSPHAEVYVDVDRDGMILAAKHNQPNIYIINPADGKIISTITMKGKKVKGEIQALSSGDIIVKTDYAESTVISRSGEEKSVIYIALDEWYNPLCIVDRLTDKRYIASEDIKGSFYVVHQVSSDGNVDSRRILEYKTSDQPEHPILRIFRNSFSCIITPGGNLVCSYGYQLHVYKKKFVV